MTLTTRVGRGGGVAKYITPTVSPKRPQRRTPQRATGNQTGKSQDEVCTAPVGRTITMYSPAPHKTLDIPATVSGLPAWRCQRPGHARPCPHRFPTLHQFCTSSADQSCFINLGTLDHRINLPPLAPKWFSVPGSAAQKPVTKGRTAGRDRGHVTDLEDRWKRYHVIQYGNHLAPSAKLAYIPAEYPPNQTHAA